MSLRLVRLLAPVAGRLDHVPSARIRQEARTGSLVERLYWRWLAWTILLVLFFVPGLALLFASGAPHLRLLRSAAVGCLIVVADAASLCVLFGVRLRISARWPGARWPGARWPRGFLEPRSLDVYAVLAADVAAVVLTLF